MEELPRGSITYPLKRSGRLESWRNRRRLERRAHEVAEAIRQRPFPLYGLPAEWECGRALMGSSYGKETGLGRVDLSHWSGEAPGVTDVRVNTFRGGRGVIEDAKEDLEYDLELRTHDDETIGELEWRGMRIPVDGISTDFVVIAGTGREWGAVGSVGDVVVAVKVRNFAMADVVLKTITDVEPYITGAEERHRELNQKKS